MIRVRSILMAWCVLLPLPCPAGTIVQHRMGATLEVQYEAEKPIITLADTITVALTVEGGWEILENSPIIINRYREATISLDYFGDSVINSVSDILAMVVGFFLAFRLPTRLIVALALAMELVVGWAIRDNLTLNILMLVHPIERVRQWQSGS